MFQQSINYQCSCAVCIHNKIIQLYIVIISNYFTYSLRIINTLHPWNIRSLYFHIMWVNGSPNTKPQLLLQCCTCTKYKLKVNKTTFLTMHWISLPTTPHHTSHNKLIFLLSPDNWSSAPPSPANLSSLNNFLQLLTLIHSLPAVYLDFTPSHVTLI